MEPQPPKGNLYHTITCGVSFSIGLLLSDIIVHAIHGGKPFLWGREIVSSLVGGACIACLYSLGRSLLTDLFTRNSDSDKN